MDSTRTFRRLPPIPSRGGEEAKGGPSHQPMGPQGQREVLQREEEHEAEEQQFQSLTTAPPTR
jgi:hypothetical protein